jgi:hypothetical protein
MSVDRIVSRGRVAAEARMTSRCTIRRETGNMVLDADNQQVPEWEIVYTDLPCRIATAPSASRSRTKSPGEVEIERATPEIHVPASTSGLLDNDHADITAGDNAGDVHRIITASWSDQATARRCPVEAVERPSEWSA